MQRPLHPLHAVLLAGTVPLFLGVLLGDWAYSNSYEIQWKNFASWLLVGGLFFAGFTLLWAIIDVFRAAHSATSHLCFAAAGALGLGVHRRTGPCRGRLG